MSLCLAVMWNRNLESESPESRNFGGIGIGITKNFEGGIGIGITKIWEPESRKSGIGITNSNVMKNMTQAAKMLQESAAALFTQF